MSRTRFRATLEIPTITEGDSAEPFELGPGVKGIAMWHDGDIWISYIDAKKKGVGAVARVEDEHDVDRPGRRGGGRLAVERAHHPVLSEDEVGAVEVQRASGPWVDDRRDPKHDEIVVSAGHGADGKRDT